MLITAKKPRCAIETNMSEMCKEPCHEKRLRLIRRSDGVAYTNHTDCEPPT